MFLQYLFYISFAIELIAVFLENTNKFSIYSASITCDLQEKWKNT